MRIETNFSCACRFFDCAGHDKSSRGPAEATRAAAAPAGFVCCACKKKGSRVLVYRSFSRGFIYTTGALCTTLARRTAARRIFSLRLPREKPSNAPGRRPRAAACHEKASRAQRQVRQPESLCALQWPRQRHRPAAATWQQFLQEVLRLPRESQPGSFIYCRCHKKKSRGPVTATCAAAVPGGFMFCTCHAAARGSYACSSIYCAFHGKDVGIALYNDFVVIKNLE